MLSTVLQWRSAVQEIPTGLINCGMIATGNHLIFIRCAEHHPRNDMLFLPACIMFTANLNDNLPIHAEKAAASAAAFGLGIGIQHFLDP